MEYIGSMKWDYETNKFIATTDFSELIPHGPGAYRWSTISMGIMRIGSTKDLYQRLWKQHMHSTFYSGKYRLNNDPTAAKIRKFFDTHIINEEIRVEIYHNPIIVYDKLLQKEIVVAPIKDHENFFTQQAITKGASLTLMTQKKA